MSFSQRLACATSCYGFTVDISETLKQISRLGFKSVEIMSIPGWFEHLQTNLNDENNIELKDRLNNLALKPVAISGHCEMGGRQGNVLLTERIALAAKLGVDIVVIGSGKIETAEEEANFYQALNDNLDFASKHNIILALETGGDYIPTGGKLASIIQKVNSPYLKATYDPANVLASGNVDIFDDINGVLPYLAHVHLKEYSPNMENFPPLGDGIVDFNKFFSLLADANYKGDFSIEVDCFECDDLEANKKLEQSLYYLKHNTTFLKYF